MCINGDCVKKPGNENDTELFDKYVKEFDMKKWILLKSYRKFVFTVEPNSCQAKGEHCVKGVPCCPGLMCSENMYKCTEKGTNF